jgi:hypothetical protein
LSLPLYVKLALVHSPSIFILPYSSFLPTTIQNTTTTKYIVNDSDDTSSSQNLKPAGLWSIFIPKIPRGRATRLLVPGPSLLPPFTFALLVYLLFHILDSTRTLHRFISHTHTPSITPDILLHSFQARSFTRLFISRRPQLSIRSGLPHRWVELDLKMSHSHTLPPNLYLSEHLL